MSIVVEILKILLFASWCIFTIYTYFQLKRNMKDLAIRNNVTVPFECKKCHTVHEYPYSEYLKIIKRVRNEYTSRYGRTIHRYREFKYPCEICGTKQWQKLLRFHPFLGSTCQSEFKSILIRAVVKVVIAGFLAPLGMYLLSTIA